MHKYGLKATEEAFSVKKSSIYKWKKLLRDNKGRLEIFNDKSKIPIKIKAVQTDNGLEFEKYFREHLQKKGITHFWNYPKHPQLNAKIERFNRTLQEEFLDYNTHLFYDLQRLNQKLMDWLIFYNTKRPHHTLNNIPPLKYIINTFGFSTILWTCNFIDKINYLIYNLNIVFYLVLSHHEEGEETMKLKAFLCLFFLVFGVSQIKGETFRAAIVEDNFNSYVNGLIAGQGGWTAYHSPWEDKFFVQDLIVFEGTKALYCNSIGDNVIGKQGNLLLDGRQIIYVRTENRSGWNRVTTDDGNAQIRITNGLWKEGICMTFTRDGYVTYYDPLRGYQKFAPYIDNEWTLVEVEWRASDTSARYQVNNGGWTDWFPFWHSEPFIGFNYVGLAFDFREGGSGGVYFDYLTVPESPTIISFITGIIFFSLFRFFQTNKV